MDKVERARVARDGANSHCFEHRIEVDGECIAFANDPWADRIAVALSQALIAERGRETDALIIGLRERIEGVVEFQGHGFWTTCTGCYESEDGYPNGDYPRSEVLGCTLGGGCSECGGLGAVWDDIDYDEMAREMLAEDGALSPQTDKGGEEDLPTEFEAWWDKSPRRNREQIGYGLKKVLAWEAFQAGRLSLLRPSARKGAVEAWREFDRELGHVVAEYPEYQDLRAALSNEGACSGD